MAIEKIVSGGQSGVDRAALDTAMQLGMPCGGWCPKDRKAEDGPIGQNYPLLETPLPDYEQRTEWNVRDSDGTLVLTEGELEGGTALTVELARQHEKPCLVVDLKGPPSSEQIANWIKRYQIHILNIAGPRESQRPGIHRRSKEFLSLVLTNNER